MEKILVGIDLGGTYVKTALVSEGREVVAKESRPSNADGGPEAVMDTMAIATRELLEASGLSFDNLAAAGIGAPGPLNWQTGIVYSPPNLPGWHHVPLGEKMQERLGVPCFIENDANAACFGEFWLGAGQGAENMAVFTLGTGVGGGIITFRQLLRGIDGTAGELGHLTISRGGRLCGCGSRGCLEAYASVSGMVQTAIENLKDDKTMLDEMCGGDFDKITGKMIYDAAMAGDAYARWIFEETATWLGLGIASIINMINPEKVVLCGGMIAAGEVLFDPVIRVAKANAFQVPGDRCQILPAGLGADSGVLGAAGCAYTRICEGQDQPA